MAKKKKIVKKLSQRTLKTEQTRLNTLSEQLVIHRDRLAARERRITERERKIGIWKTGDGRALEIQQMDEGHLRNTVSFLQRKLAAKFGTAVYLDEVTPLAESFVAMLAECRRRGIRV